MKRFQTQIMREFNAVGATGIMRGLYGERLATPRRLTHVYIQEWPHALQILHIVNVKTGSEYVYQPVPGMTYEVPPGVYVIRTSYETALLSSWRVILWLSDSVFIGGTARPHPQVQPIVRGFEIRPGLTGTWEFIPKDSGMIRYIFGHTAGDKIVTLYRYENGLPTIVTRVHEPWTQLTAIPGTYAEFAATIEAVPRNFQETAYITAGIMYAVLIENPGQVDTMINLDISTERR